MTSSTPAGLRPASTIVLCRDRQGRLEVLMVKRHHQIDFASGALVFPGGKVSAADTVDEEAARGADLAPDVVPFYLAAMREAFEECGLLLAEDEAAGQLVSAERAEALGEYRLAVEKEEIPFQAFLRAQGLRAAYDRLVPFARWLTPTFMPKRFDTWFFIAEAPGEQIALHDGVELVDTEWLAPADALAGGEDGRFTIIFPTRCNLQLLSQYGSTAEAIDDAKRRSIEPIEPWVEDNDGMAHLVIPATSGYPMTREAFNFPR